MALTLGPLVTSLPRLLLLAGMAAGLLVAWQIRRRHGVNAEPSLWLALLAGLIAARLGYVLTHLAFFASHPLDIIKVWQGGFLPLAGVAAALATAAGLACLNSRRDGVRPALLLAPLTAGLLIWGGTSWLAQALEQGVQRDVPRLPLKTLDGEPVLLSDYGGRPMVVNVWASWCPPCRREMPLLAAAAADNPGITFVFLNQGEGPDTVRAYLDDTGLDLPDVLLDVFSRSATSLSARGLPTTLFFDGAGRLVNTAVGEISEPRLQDHMQRLNARKER